MLHSDLFSFRAFAFLIPVLFFCHINDHHGSFSFCSLPHLPFLILLFPFLSPFLGFRLLSFSRQHPSSLLNRKTKPVCFFHVSSSYYILNVCVFILSPLSCLPSLLCPFPLYSLLSFRHQCPYFHASFLPSFLSLLFLLSFFVLLPAVPFF